MVTSEPRHDPSDSRKSRALPSMEHLVLGLLVVAVAVANLAWIGRDTRPQPFTDPYPERIIGFVDALRAGGVVDLPELVSQLSVGGRPPLYQSLTMPFVAGIERSVDAMLIVNTLALIVLAVAVFKIASMTASRWTGVLAAVIALGYPPIVNLSRTAKPHSIVPAAVALGVWLLLLLVERRQVATAWCFGASLAIAFLIHPNSLYLWGFPVAILSIGLIFFHLPPRSPQGLRQLPGWASAKMRDRFVRVGLLPALIAAVLVSAPWYLWQLEAVTTLSSLSADYWSGLRAGFQEVAGSWWWYAATMPGTMSRFFAYLLVVSCGLVAASGRHESGRLHALLPVILVLMYGGMLLRQGLSSWMNFAPVLPVAAVITALGVVGVARWIAGSGRGARRVDDSGPDGRGSAIRGVMAALSIALCVAMAVLNYSIAGWGIPRQESLQRSLGAPLDSACSRRIQVAFCPNPPVGGDWQAGRILDRVVSDPDCGPRGCRVCVVTQNPEFFSIGELQYTRALNHPRTRVPLTKVWKGARQELTLDWLRSDYLVYVSPEGASPARRYGRSIVDLLESLPPGYEHFFRPVGEYPLPNGSSVRLVRRDDTMTDSEALELVDLLDIPESLKHELMERGRARDALESSRLRR